MSILINQTQINGLVSSLQSLQSQISSLDYFSTTGGAITGDVSISGDLSVIGSFNLSGGVFRFDSTNGRLGINNSAPSGSIHITSNRDNATFWIDGNPNGGSPDFYPSIKMLNSTSGVSSEIGIAAPSLPLSSFDGGELFINHGANLVSNETGEREIQFLITGSQSFGINSSGVSIPSGKSLYFNDSQVGSFSFSLSSGDNITLDSVDGSSFRSAFYNLSIQNPTGSRAQDYFLSWNSGVSVLSETGSSFSDVGNTSGLQISGYKSGTSVLLRAASNDTGWNVAGMYSYL